MANKSLFASMAAKLLPSADAKNCEAAPAYAYGPGPSCTGFRPVYDRYGNVVGQRPVNIC